MKTLATRLQAADRYQISAAPEGYDAQILAELATDLAPMPVLHIALDDNRMAALAELVQFFAPDLEIIQIPAWDCLPYDRVSPHRDILAARIDAFARLLETQSPVGGRLVLTTISAALQRVPPRGVFKDRTLIAKAGSVMPLDRLTRFFATNGYSRSETVSEPGEYAIRGGILDVYPPGQENPLRLDFFGDELDSLRHFDPMSQLTTGEAESLELRPVGEVILDEKTIEAFRLGYRESFGTVGKDDPLYEAISEGRQYPGMEHWLPLFYGELETVFDYLPEVRVTLDAQSEEARDARIESITDFYQARQSMGKVSEKSSDSGTTYKPVAMERLFLSVADWDAQLTIRGVAQFSPFELPDHQENVLDAEGKLGKDFSESRNREGVNVFDEVRDYIRLQQNAGKKIVVTGYTDGSRDRLISMFHEHEITNTDILKNWKILRKTMRKQVQFLTMGLERGVVTPDVVFITEQDILGERIARAQKKRRKSDNFLREASSLQDNDFVVHMEHGIGQYIGLETVDVGGAPHDCLKVLYHGGDKLFVPVENIEVLSRYGSEDSGAELDRLGGVGWQARKARVKERIREIAHQLIGIAANRLLRKAETIDVPEGLYDEFAARFPYPETEDQLNAIEDVFTDLRSGRPMDRLICGDVGFGKTEVALRAAFVAVMSGKQVAIVVPTTLLARQHYLTFVERFKGLPVRIGQLSRLANSKQQTETKKGLAAGTVEIVVGTHAVFSKNIKFSDLGLLIVDEEQHFGVKQKERLKELRTDVHVLTLTATPIPRTLQMAMSGVKEMSLIATPPVDRLAARTFILPFDPVIVREAILREHYRGGQTFYVCPRLSDIKEMKEKLTKLVPEVKLCVAHGQLAPTELEEVMTAFCDHQYDVLLSTNIIESGLDIPSANTMIVHRADMFGLAQLYQIRGRIGRSKIRGYCYLTLPVGKLLSKTAERRLEVMQTLDSLGAGFTLASHDMDIRGAGNLVGDEQSGHIKEVGVELYQQMLEEAIATLRSDEVNDVSEDVWSPQINIGSSVLIPDHYVADLNVRLGLYRRLSGLTERAEIDGFAAELIDRFGDIPVEVENLLQVMMIKGLCKECGVEKVDAGPKGAVISFRNDSFANPSALIIFIQEQVGTVKIRPDHKLVYRRAWDDPASRLKGVRSMMEELVSISKK
ncbi:transcription-repair coupling factor [Kiloniella laminariae]|uniref:Transcription-repair-coupling factor n=1 Tax=Kiloniella laminariae TaxID=454162 RepID=A0ABT4LNE5_9PROT|nr:transcription-repair coupling factor [Kiloniella laminariae]MCZ4282599.1 transcription-repair coupling factor [Kiloniella laminariae]